jgi:hypothetical protein
MTRVPALRRIAAVFVAVAALGLTGAGSQNAAADANANTGDDSVAVPTQWWTFEGLTRDQAFDLAQSRNARVTDIDVNPGGDTLNGVMVSNTGVYQSNWWLYAGLDETGLNTAINANRGRITRLVPYMTVAGLRYATLMVPNVGVQFRPYTMLAPVTSAASLSTYPDLRLVELSAVTVAGTTNYWAILVPNTGVDHKAWWLSTGLTTAALRAQLTSRHARLLRLQRTDDGTYDAVMVGNTGSEKMAWKYLLGLTSLAQVNAAAEQYGMRPIHLQRYSTSSGTRYDLVMIDNVPAETRRLTALVLPHVVNKAGVPTAKGGFYLKRVKGSVAHSLMADRSFDPATGIAALQNLAIMRQVQQGTIGLGSTISRFDYPHSPSPSWITVGDRCPVARDETVSHKVPQTVNAVHDAMMSAGDTRSLRAITRRFGLAGLRKIAAAAGLTHTALGQAFVGCGVTGGRNTTTLVDLAHLYEGVATGSLLPNTHGARTEFWQPMNGIVRPSAMAAMVRQEASRLGKSSAVAKSFLARLTMQSMQGRADVPCDDFTLGCNGTVTKVEFLNYAGRVSVPFKRKGAIAARTYVFDDFLTDVRASWSTSDAGNLAYLGSLTVELLRTTVRAALATW